MVHDVADFLRGHAPFDVLDEAELDTVARAAEIEFHERGAVLLRQGAEPTGHVWVVRSGAVELLDGGRALDLLGEGEMIGHPSMLSGLPVTFEVQAAEDVLLYRLPGEVVAPVLARPSGVRFVARTLQERPVMVEGAVPADAALAGAADPALRPVRALIRSAPVVCEPDTAIREAARRMQESGTSAVVVAPADGVGIVTDRDLRSRVATGEVPVDAPVERRDDLRRVHRRAGPARGATCSWTSSTAACATPRSSTGPGRVLGVLDDLDLLATEARLPFRLRRAAVDAPSPEAVADAARQLPGAVVALFDAGLAPDTDLARSRRPSWMRSRAASSISRSTRSGRRPRRSRGWRSAASAAARPCCPPTPTRGSCGTGTTPTRGRARWAGELGHAGHGGPGRLRRGRRRARGARRPAAVRAVGRTPGARRSRSGWPTPGRTRS